MNDAALNNDSVTVINGDSLLSNEFVAGRTTFDDFNDNADGIYNTDTNSSFTAGIISNGIAEESIDDDEPASDPLENVSVNQNDTSVSREPTDIQPTIKDGPSLDDTADDIDIDSIIRELGQKKNVTSSFSPELNIPYSDFECSPSEKKKPLKKRVTSSKKFRQFRNLDTYSLEIEKLKEGMNIPLYCLEFNDECKQHAMISVPVIAIAKCDDLAKQYAEKQSKNGGSRSNVQANKRPNSSKVGNDLVKSKLRKTSDLPSTEKIHPENKKAKLYDKKSSSKGRSSDCGLVQLDTSSSSQPRASSRIKEGKEFIGDKVVTSNVAKRLSVSILEPENTSSLKLKISSSPKMKAGDKNIKPASEEIIKKTITNSKLEEKKDSRVELLKKMIEVANLKIKDYNKFWKRSKTYEEKKASIYVYLKENGLNGPLTFTNCKRLGRAIQAEQNTSAKVDIRNIENIVTTTPATPVSVLLPDVDIRNIGGPAYADHSTALKHVSDLIKYTDTEGGFNKKDVEMLRKLNNIIQRKTSPDNCAFNSTVYLMGYMKRHKELAFRTNLTYMQSIQNSIKKRMP